MRVFIKQDLAELICHSAFLVFIAFAAWAIAPFTGG